MWCTFQTHFGMGTRHFQKEVPRLKLLLSLRSFTCHKANVGMWKYVFTRIVIKIKVFHSCRTRVFYVALLPHLRRAFASRVSPVSHLCRTYLVHFYVNEVFCLLNKFVLFMNQKQPLKCVWQNSYLDLWSYTLYIIWQGVSYFTRNLSQAFFNALTSAQKLHCRTIIFEKLLRMTASVLIYDHDIILIKRAESVELFWYEEVAGRWIEIKVC